MRSLPTLLPLMALALLAVSCATAPANAPEAATSGPKSLQDSLAEGTSAPAPSPAPFDPAMIAWDHDPQAPVIIVSQCCGMVPEQIRLNYLPNAQVYGDGSVIWTRSVGHRRQVLRGQLSEAALRGLLLQAGEQGFFGWQAHYTEPLAPADLAEKCITINLTDLRQQVCEYYRGAPTAFGALFTTLADGAGLRDGQPYVPTRAYLTATPPSAGIAPPADLPPESRWDASANGLSLAEAENGVWVEGPALAAAWQLVNAYPNEPLAQDGNDYYLLALQIPGVSFTAPPAE